MTVDVSCDNADDLLTGGGAYDPQDLWEVTDTYKPTTFDEEGNPFDTTVWAVDATLLREVNLFATIQAQAYCLDFGDPH